MFYKIIYIYYLSIIDHILCFINTYLDTTNNYMSLKQNKSTSNME